MKEPGNRNPSAPPEGRQALSAPGGAARVGLHVCCAVCATEPIAALLEAGIRPVVLFCNSNMDTPEEYAKRRDETIRYADARGVECVDGQYEPEGWRDAVQGLESEPERGRRCDVCFRLRLARAAELCAARDIAVLATTLGISRYKDLEQVNRAGRVATARTPGVEFWAVNWRKRGGSVRADALARSEGLYRQNYCGCVYSRRAGREGRGA